MEMKRGSESERDWSKNGNGDGNREKQKCKVRMREKANRITKGNHLKALQLKKYWYCKHYHKTLYQSKVLSLEIKAWSIEQKSQGGVLEN